MGAVTIVPAMRFIRGLLSIFKRNSVPEGQIVAESIPGASRGRLATTGGPSTSGFRTAKGPRRYSSIVSPRASL